MSFGSDGVLATNIPESSKNLVFVTHYVVINEVLNYAPSSGEIVISDIKFKKKSNIEIKY